MKYITIMLAALMCLSINISCNKETFGENINDTTQDIFQGYNVVQLKPKNGELRIPLNPDRRARLKSISWDKLRARISKDEREHSLILSLAEGEEEVAAPRLVTIDMEYPENNDDDWTNVKKRTLNVVVKNSNYEIPKDEYEKDPANAIGKGMNIAGEIGGINCTDLRIFDYNSIHELMLKGKMQLQQSRTYEIEGDSYKSTLYKASGEAGVSGQTNTFGIGEKGKLIKFSGSLSSHGAIEKKHQDYYEYSITNIEKKMYMIGLGGFKDRSASFYLPYLEATANDALNNPGSTTYRNYSNDEKGVRELIKAYGTNVITKGIFGGRYSYIYGRKKNVYSKTISEGSIFSFSTKFPTSDTPSNKPLAQYLVNKRTTAGLDANYSFDTSNTEEEEISHSISTVLVIGGDPIGDGDSWEKSFTEENVVLISYGEPILPNDTTENGGLEPLINFIVDPARKAAFDKYYNKIVEEMLTITEPTSKMIVADIYMKKAKNNSAKDYCKAQYMEGGDGVKRIYYPMIVNNRYPKEEGKALETSKDAYIVVCDACDQYWLVALDWELECSGIVDVKFSKDDVSTLTKDGFTRRGARADDDMDFNNIDNDYLCVKYRKNDSKDAPITGFGMCHGEKQNMDLNKKDLSWENIYSSSVLTEQTIPATLDEQLAYYWNGSNMKYNKSTHSWFGKSGAIQPNHLYPVYTTVALPLTFDYKKVRLPKE